MVWYEKWKAACWTSVRLKMAFVQIKKTKHVRKKNKK